ncbi:MAG: hypothetical protein SGCHY_004147, partial [Lobulomycetales sp.]
MHHTLFSAATCFLLLSAVCSVAVESVQSLVDRAAPGLPEDIAEIIAREILQANLNQFSSILAGFPDGSGVLRHLAGLILEAETDGSVIASAAYSPPNQVRMQLQNGTEYLASFVRKFQASVHNFDVDAFHTSCDDQGATLTLVKLNDQPVAYAGYN